jgi:hypothetical protein
MALALDAKNQIYIPVALVLIGCAIVKPKSLPIAAALVAVLAWLKFQGYSAFLFR